MKRLFTLLTAIIVCVGTIFASNTSVDGIWYNFDSSTLTAEVTYRSTHYNTYNEYSNDVNIPSSVTYSDKTYSVTSIGDYAFCNCNGLTSVTIPNSVTSIGTSAFYGCSGLTSVTIGNSVTSFGYNAFEKCTSLTSVTINSNYIVSKEYSSSWSIINIFGSQVNEYILGESVISIGYLAFNGCTKLTSVTIPNSVTSIGECAFYGCTNLLSLTIPHSVTSIGTQAFYAVPNIIYSGTITGSPWGAKAVNGYVDGYFVYSDNTKTNLWACSSAATGEIILPNNIIIIGNYAFNECNSLTSVEIPNSVTSIGNYAFSHCSGLSSIEIPNSVTTIGDSAFSNCGGLKEVTLNSNVIVSKSYTSNSSLKHIFGTQVKEYHIGEIVTSIGNHAFHGCSQLVSIEIPNSVTSIGNSAFQDCGLPSIEIPNSVTSIGGAAFSGCRSLTSIEIPNSVTSIGNYIFNSCTKLTSVTIGNSVTSIGSNAFLYCDVLTSVTIPNGVTRIEDSTFESCHHLTSIEIPNSVISIGGRAFANCHRMTSIEIPSSVTSIGNYAFYGCSNLTDIYATCGDLQRLKQVYNSNRVKYKPLSYTITANAVNGYVNTPKNSCDALELKAIPNSGYHFVQWNDGNNDNPRAIELTQDTTFTAEFAVDHKPIIRVVSINGSSSAFATNNVHKLVLSSTGVDVINTEGSVLLSVPLAEIARVEFTEGEPEIPTDIEQTPLSLGEDKRETTKFIRNGQLFILHNGTIYDVHGHVVKIEK